MIRWKMGLRAEACRVWQQDLDPGLATDGYLHSRPMGRESSRIAPERAGVDNCFFVAKYRNVKAELITRFKDVTPEGGIIELVVWRTTPRPVPPCGHCYKYRLVFVLEGKRAIGFDNERGKGDHYHVEEEERHYTFRDLDGLIEDFIAEVERWRSGH
jgi:hypothetical protein